MNTTDLQPSQLLFLDYTGAPGFQGVAAEQIEKSDGLTATIDGQSVQVNHVAIYLGNGRVGEAIPGRGVSINPLADCLAGARLCAVRLPNDPADVLQRAVPILQAGGGYSYLDIGVLAEVMPLRNSNPTSIYQRLGTLRKIDEAAFAVALWQRQFPSMVCSELASSYFVPPLEIASLRCDPADDAYQCPACFKTPMDLLLAKGGMGPPTLLDLSANRAASEYQRRGIERPERLATAAPIVHFGRGF